MKDLEDLKKETEADLEAARERRLDRQAKDRRDGPILDAFERMSRSGPVEYTPGRRHPPKLQLIDEALDDVEATPEQVASTMSNLQTTPSAWATEVRARAEEAPVDEATLGHLERSARDDERQEQVTQIRPTTLIRLIREIRNLRRGSR